MPDSPLQTRIETNRLLLKEVTPEIHTALFTNYTDADIMAFLGLRGADDLETERIKWQGGMTTYRTSFKQFLLCSKDTGKIIGKVGFHNWYAMHARAELGYMMTNEEEKRKGYMKEAVAPVIRFGFEEMGLNRIEAYAGITNEASLKIIRGFGFTEEGTLRDHFCYDGTMVDSICFGLLKREYGK